MMDLVSPNNTDFSVVSKLTPIGLSLSGAITALPSFMTVPFQFGNL